MIRLLVIVALLTASFLFAQDPAMSTTQRTIVPAKIGGKPVPPEVMQRIYDEAKTSFKYGIVVRGEENQQVDCPTVFRHGGRWYMTYVGIANKIGYETFLARSDDLLHWEKLGKILKFGGEGAWDRWQADLGIALQDPTWGGSAELTTHDGKYWGTYIGGALQGYETDPLSMGVAWTTTPSEPIEWNRYERNPVLTPHQEDARDFEAMTLYKANVIRDDEKSLGFPFIMFYNAKYQNGHEQIGMAVSEDMVNWRRYGEKSIINNVIEKRGRPSGMSGDPQIVRMDDGAGGKVWVMFYFGHGYKPKAFDTFAASYDLATWTNWEGEHLVEPSEPWDENYAHKPWIIKHDGVVYHFYCAVGTEGRQIALATSKDMRP